MEMPGAKAPLCLGHEQEYYVSTPSLLCTFEDHFDHTTQRDTRECNSPCGTGSMQLEDCDISTVSKLFHYIDSSVLQ